MSYKKTCIATISLLILLLLITLATAQQNFTRPAPHPCFVRITVGNQGGSGVIAWVSANPPATIILTAKHVVETGGTISPQAKITFVDGSTKTAKTSSISRTQDVASLLIADWKAAEYVPIAETLPQQGSAITMAGYGGHPRSGFAMYAGHLRGSWGGTLSVGNKPSHGDSGGPALDPKGLLIGVISAYDDRGQGVIEPVVSYRSKLPTLAADFAARNRLPSQAPSGPITRQIGGCPGGVCPTPQPYQGQPYPQQQAPQITPPQIAPMPDPYAGNQSQLQEILDSQRKITSELAEMRQRQDALAGDVIQLQSTPKCECPEQKPTEIDYDALADKLVDRMAADERFRGPPGVAGKDGRDGANGRDADLAIPANDRHFVVVAEPEARYANRLEYDVEKTKEYFDRIDLVPPPENKNVGTLPAIVLYVNGAEAFTARGTGDVATTLSRIRRGEFN